MRHPSSLTPDASRLTPHASRLTPDASRLTPRACVTGCVIALNEAANLAELLPQLRWADEVLVVIDAATIDESRAVAAAFADRVEVRPFVSFPSFRNAALEMAGGQWVLFVDADERASPELADEVRAAVAASEGAIAAGQLDAPVGYWVPRHNFIFGRRIRGGGWSPDYQLRLIRRGSGRYDATRPVHEVVLLDGPSGYLSQPLVHLNYRSLRQFYARQRRYTAMEAAGLRAQGVRASRRALAGAPLREFWRRYVGLAGWKDGPIGLFLSGAMAYYALQRTRLLRRG